MNFTINFIELLNLKINLSYDRSRQYNLKFNISGKNINSLYLCIFQTYNDEITFTVDFRRYYLFENY